MSSDRELKSKQRTAKLATLETTPEFQILSRFMEQTDISPTIAVQQILELTTLNCNLGTLGDHFYNTACSIIALGQRTAPEKQYTLVTFVVELQKNKVLDPKTGKTLSHDNELVWTELPTFSWTFGDELHDGWPSDPGNTPDDIRRIENLNAFVAQMSATSIVPTNDSMGWPALIFQYTWPKLPKGHTLNFVRVACLWYIYAADKLLAAALDKDNEFFTKELWDVYKERLLESQVKIRNQDARKLIDHAVVQMKRVEGSG